MAIEVHTVRARVDSTRLFLFLRSLRATQPLRVRDREDAFYEYGGFRIWIRSVSRKPA